MMQQIFEGFNTEPAVAKDLAAYWKVAGDKFAAINDRGHLRTKDGKIWARPQAAKHYNELKAAFEAHRPSFVIIGEDTIYINFQELSYNLQWIKELLHAQKLGVCDSEQGLKLYKKKNGANGMWYDHFAWTLQNVTVNELGLKKHEVVRTSASDSVDDVEWSDLYFAG